MKFIAIGLLYFILATIAINDVGVDSSRYYAFYGASIAAMLFYGGIIFSKWVLSKPHIDIGDGYLWRWHIIPRNKYFNVYLHKFMRSDSDRNLHDHPWWSVSILLKGSIGERSADVGFCNMCRCSHEIQYSWKYAHRFIPFFRPATHAHKIMLVGREPAWTIFITGRKVRDWGFYTKKGWVHHTDYIKSPEEYNKEGSACFRYPG